MFCFRFVLVSAFVLISFFYANVGIVWHFVLLVKHVFQKGKKVSETNISETATIP